ncbi:hypothetical protein B6S44_07695 [Bosea sp. Tri-44]|uniref:hypothetical protein n=1 Tax=Bosea sp. Tri-44 TaxID=1972137 RepID=UPI00100EC05F|nr:hypothetical protein [Bosea sp. Tri-44]RXT55961.1 hypothetical protein B6S44_07695 [Bosea sp. Tri-44]
MLFGCCRGSAVDTIPGQRGLGREAVRSFDEGKAVDGLHAFRERGLPIEADEPFGRLDLSQTVSKATNSL